MQDNKKGLTLIELIVVLAISATILVSVAVSLVGYTEKFKAQKDDSQMNEITRTVKMALADQNVYDECVNYFVTNNYSCYVDSKYLKNENAKMYDNASLGYFTYSEETRIADETIFYAAGKMRGMTITFQPTLCSSYSNVYFSGAKINSIRDQIEERELEYSVAPEDTDSIYLGNMKQNGPGFLFGRLKQSFGGYVILNSNTYRYSDYTVFIKINIDGFSSFVSVYGQWNGTNLAGYSREKEHTIVKVDPNGSGETYYVPKGGAMFTDGTFLTWDQLRLPENGDKYGYKCGCVTNTELKMEAFADCDTLVSIIIPVDIKRFGGNIFGNCISLQDITYYGTLTDWNSINKNKGWSYNFPITCGIHCSDGDFFFEK